jgi:hypothetical protein
VCSSDLGIINYPVKNLFDYLYHSINKICEYLEIKTPIIVSSTLEVNDNLLGQERVISIVKVLGGDEYINPIGAMGSGLYSIEAFESNSIRLSFLEPRRSTYSILDVIMKNSKELVRASLGEYDICKD